jgi:hypothetical protein
MHDRNGKPLKEGDLVLIPCVVKSLQATEEYCNVGLETLYGRRPDGAKETVYAINTAVTVLVDFKA